MHGDTARGSTKLQKDATETQSLGQSSVVQKIVHLECQRQTHKANSKCQYSLSTQEAIDVL